MSSTASGARRARSGELRHVNAELVVFAVLQQFFPRNVASQPTCHSTEHGTQSRLHSRVRLIMEISRGDAIDEAAIFLTLRLCQVVAEDSIGGELGWSGRLRRLISGPRPRLFAHDPHRPGIRNLGMTISAKHARRHVEPIIRPELRAGKTDVNI